MTKAKASAVGMRRRWSADFMAFGIVAIAAASAGHAQTAAPEYKLHPGDKVIVGVYDDPKLLPQEMTVSPDGKISYPLAGELTVGGKSVGQIRVEMAGGGKPYAKMDGIIVIRSTPAGQRVLPFKYGQVSAGKDLTQNVDLESGDVVVVP